MRTIINDKLTVMSIQRPNDNGQMGGARIDIYRK